VRVLAMLVAIFAGLGTASTGSAFAGADCAAIDPLLVGFASVIDVTSVADSNANGVVCELVIDTTGSLAQVDDVAASDVGVLFVGTCPDHFTLGPGGPPPAGADRNGDGLVCRKLVDAHFIEVDNNSRASR
jgi:hypothetical protein